MDPSFVDNQIWHGISTMLRLLWVYVLLIIGFAFNFLLAHAVIPSLASAGQLPERFVKLRRFFYLAAFGALGLAAVVFFLTVLNLDVLSKVWDRWGI